MSAHTPGPWEWRDDKLIAVGDSTIVIDFAPYDGMWFSGFDDVEAANRGIIAAAPELLAALKWAFQTVREPRLIRGQNDQHCEAYENARAAIAKAEGKS